MAVWPYSTTRWQRIRAAQLRREPLCALCRPRVVAATDADHVVAIADGGDPWRGENLRSLCHACHSRVTRAWQLGRELRVKGCDVTGLPLDPGHPWRREDCSDVTPPDRRGSSGET